MKDVQCIVYRLEHNEKVIVNVVRRKISIGNQGGEDCTFLSHRVGTWVDHTNYISLIHFKTCTIVQETRVISLLYILIQFRKMRFYIRTALVIANFFFYRF